MTDMLVEFGSAVKVMSDGLVGGYLVKFGDPDSADLDGEYFTKNTDFGLDRSTKSVILYDHALDPTLKGRKLGMGELRVDDAGVWLEAQLERRDDYEKAIYQMAKSGKLGWSSGTAAHLVERRRAGKATEITVWPLGLDASLTPIPCDPRSAVVTLKSWAEGERVSFDALKTTFDTPSSGLSQEDRLEADRLPRLVDDHQAAMQRVVKAVSDGALDAETACKGLEGCTGHLERLYGAEKSAKGEAVKLLAYQAEGLDAGWTFDPSGYIASDMAMGVLCRINDGLYYQVVMPAMQDTDAPISDRMQAIRDAFATYQRLALQVIEAILTGVGAESSEEAVKSIRQFIGQRDPLGVALADQAAAVVSANAQLRDRLASRLEARTKSGRMLSEANRTALQQAHESLSGVVGSLSDLLTKAAPPADPEAVDPLAEEARFEEILAALNGVALV